MRKSNKKIKIVPVKKVRKKDFPIRFIAMILSLVTITFTILAIANNANWYYKVVWQSTLGLLMLLNGMEAVLLLKKKKLGYTLLVVSAFVLACMIYTVVYGLKTNAFK